MSPDPAVRLAKTAAAAWDRYASTVRLGGTDTQRRWAFDQALAAELKLARHERAVTPTPAPAVA